MKSTLTYLHALKTFSFATIGAALSIPLAAQTPAVLTSSDAPKQKPNIIVIVAEDMGLHVGCYGDHTVPTPNIDRLAQEGVRFDNGYVTQASCSPSRSSILTGLHVYQNFQLGLSHMGYTMHKGVPNLPELLKQKDYRTAILGKLHVNPENEFLFDYRSGSKDVAILATRADDFLGDTGDQPFFLMFNLWDCHRDQTGSGPPFPDTRFGLPEDPVGSDDVSIFPEHGEIDEPNVREEVAGYYNSVRRVDIGIGMLLDVLAKHKKLDNTMIIFIGDHGPAFSRGKTTTYEFGIKVPYIVRWPGMAKPGLESEALVSTIDIVPTCMSAAGLEVPSYLPGKSLVPVLQGEDGNWRSTLVAEWHTHGPGFQQPQRSIRDGRYKLILNMRPGVGKPGLGIDGCKVAQALKLSRYDGTEVQRVFNMLRTPPEIELYNLQEDPIEYHNLADDPGYREIKEDLIWQLQSYRERTGDPFLDPAFFESVLQYTDANARRGKFDMTPFQRNFKDVQDGLLFIVPRE